MHFYLIVLITKSQVRCPPRGQPPPTSFPQLWIDNYKNENYKVQRSNINGHISSFLTDPKLNTTWMQLIENRTKFPVQHFYPSVPSTELHTPGAHGKAKRCPREGIRIKSVDGMYCPLLPQGSWIFFFKASSPSVSFLTFKRPSWPSFNSEQLHALDWTGFLTLAVIPTRSPRGSGWMLSQKPSRKAWFGYGWGTSGVGTWILVKTQWLGIKNHQKVIIKHQKPSKIIKISIFNFWPKYAKNTYFRTGKYALCTENYALFTGYTFGTGQIRRFNVENTYFHDFSGSPQKSWISRWKDYQWPWNQRNCSWKFRNESNGSHMGKHFLFATATAVSLGELAIIPWIYCFAVSPLWHQQLSG